jgi:uncharacterized protein YcbK (DUF882 family)
MKLTTNFSLSEFHSNDGVLVPDILLCNVEKLAKALQVIRDHFQRRIDINSGYRSVAHNKAVGGAPRSTHLEGMGADIVVQGYSPIVVAATIERLIAEGKIPKGGLHAYNTFTHYDIRGTNARW